MSGRHRRDRVKRDAQVARRPTSGAFLSCALLVLCAACGLGGGDSDLRITWDGEACSFEGPTEMPAGPVAIDFVNESEEVLKVNLMRHTGSETVQDMIDYLGPAPSSQHQPSWVVDLGTWDYPVWTEDWPGFTGKTVTWEGDLEPGTYTMVCAQVTPTYGVWFGTGLTLEAG